MLYSVATPIGNREDITLRALRILREVDFILCEDTRVTSKLLAMHEIKNTLVSYHHHSSEKKIAEIVERLQNGESAAIVTDAGTPGISDPGNILIQKALEQEVEVSPIPGPSAVATALSIAGVPTDKFVFLGFVPHKKGRKTLFENIAQQKETVVLYESPHRITKTLTQLSEYIAEKEIIVCRELTKKFETIYRGTIESILSTLKEKGEFVVIIPR